MTPVPPPNSRDEEFWREFLTNGGDTMKGIGRRLFSWISANPRCRMCAAPFAGPGARVMRLVGKRQLYELGKAVGLRLPELRHPGGKI